MYILDSGWSIVTSNISIYRYTPIAGVRCPWFLCPQHPGSTMSILSPDLLVNLLEVCWLVDPRYVIRWYESGWSANCMSVKWEVVIFRYSIIGLYNDYIMWQDVIGLETYGNTIETSRQIFKPQQDTGLINKSATNILRISTLLVETT